MTGHHEYLRVDNSHAVNTPFLRADSIRRLDAARNRESTVPGQGNSLYIGQMQSGGRPPADQPRVMPPRERLRGKSMASIPELPWKKGETQ